MSRLKLGTFILLALILTITPLAIACSSSSNGDGNGDGNGNGNGNGSTPEEPIVMRLTSHWPPSDPTIVMMHELDAIIDEATDGRVKFEQYHGSQLYGLVEGLMAVQSGDIEMVMAGTEMTPINKKWDVLSSLAWLVDDEAHFLRFLETDEGEAFFDELEDIGLKHITYLGYRGTFCLFNSKHTTETMEDFSDVKYWFPAFSLFLSQADALGIQAVAMDAAEFTVSLETGMIDGCFAPMLVSPVWQLYELCQYCIPTGIGFSAPFFAVNSDFWNGLPSDLQETLEDVFEDFGQRTRTMWAEEMDKDAQDYLAAGGVISEMTPAEKARWLEAVQPIYDAEMEDPEIKEFIEAVLSVK